MNVRLPISLLNNPKIMILMVLLMHPELRLSTIRITTGLSPIQTREGLLELVEDEIIEVTSVSLNNPTFRLLDQQKAKDYLETIAKLSKLV